MATGAHRPRGPGRPPDLVLELCRELELVHVVDPLADATVTPEQTFLRLHGVTGARHIYADAELSAVVATLPNAERAYVMFSNLPWMGEARRFRAMIGTALIPMAGKGLDVGDPSARRDA